VGGNGLRKLATSGLLARMGHFYGMGVSSQVDRREGKRYAGFATSANLPVSVIETKLNSNRAMDKSQVDSDKTPILELRRSLLTVVIWSAIVFVHRRSD